MNKNRFNLTKFYFYLSFVFWTACINSQLGTAQSFEAGFNPNEYAELLRITARQRGEIPDSLFPEPNYFYLSYTSDSLGLDNGWQLWLPKDENSKVAIISIRATTIKKSSWLENLYCPMANASGSIQLENDFVYNYKFAESPEATVHQGWLIGTGYVQRDVLPLMEKLYDQGYKDYVIFGHSQGGAISYLLTSSLHYLQEDGKLPADIRFKTYGSAAPKPGNLFYAYDYERITLGGWAYNVISDQDWVPEAPMSIQTMVDYSYSSPFTRLKEGTKSLPWIQRIVVRGKLNSISRKLEKSSKQMNKIMGRQLTSLVNGYLPEYVAPVPFENNNNYQRTGDQRVLVAEKEYFKRLPDEKKDMFRNHMMDAYQLLLEVYYQDQLEDEYIIYLNNRYEFQEHPKIPH